MLSVALRPPGARSVNIIKNGNVIMCKVCLKGTDNYKMIRTGQTTQGFVVYLA